MIRAFALLALALSSPLAAQSRPRDAAPPVSHREKRYNPLARYDELTERVDRKNARAHAYQRDTPEISRWKRRQHIDETMDDDEGEE